MSKKYKIANGLIHGFTFAHALVVVLFKLFDLPDEIPLTILTVLMIVLVARLNDFPYDLTAVMALMFSFAGYFVGSTGSEWMMANGSEFVSANANAIMTIIVTELVGWLIYYVTNYIQSQNGEHV